MSNTLRQARILSSENDASVKQEQSTNVNIKITPNKSTPQVMGAQAPPAQVTYPQVSPVNFTSQTTASAFPSVQATSRGIADLGTELDTLEKKNKFLEMLVAMYETNPLKINSYVVCDSKLLMNMIKLLTDADKIELVLDESDVGCGCGLAKARPEHGGRGANSKFIKIDKILVYKNNKAEDLKYGYNEIYTQFIRYGVSLKIVV